MIVDVEYYKDNKLIATNGYNYDIDSIKLVRRVTKFKHILNANKFIITRNGIKRTILDKVL